MSNASAITAVLLALVIATFLFRKSARPDSRELEEASQLWRACLSGSPATAYEEIFCQANSCFVMFSVALEDALSTRQEEPVLAMRLVEMSVELERRFEDALLAVIQVVEQTSRSLHRLPLVQPLVPENFHTTVAVSLARRQNLLHRILLSSRMRFFYKLDCIRSAASLIADHFALASEKILRGGSSAPAGWQAVDDVQYDLNTLWQESQILLKAILHFTANNLAAGLPGQFQAERERREAARLVAQPTPVRVR